MNYRLVETANVNSSNFLNIFLVVTRSEIISRNGIFLVVSFSLGIEKIFREMDKQTC